MNPTVARIVEGPVAPMFLHFMAGDPPPERLVFALVPPGQFSTAQWVHVDEQSADGWLADPDVETAIYRRRGDHVFAMLGEDAVWNYEPA